MDDLLKALRAVDKPDMAYGYDGPYKWRSEDIARDAAETIRALSAEVERQREVHAFWMTEEMGVQAQLKQELSALREAQRWIPVAERLPTSEDADLAGDVIVHTKGAAGGKFWPWDYVKKISNVDCWRRPLPLPAGPEGE